MTDDDVEKWMERIAIAGALYVAKELPVPLTVPDIEDAFDEIFGPGGGDDDERHICPLQLDVIERAIHLWINPGDLVLTPFMGIGSEAVSAVKMGRRAWGCELKQSYFELACRNMDDAITPDPQIDMFQ